MRALPILIVVLAGATALAQDAAPEALLSQPLEKAVKVEFFWGEGQHVPGVTADKGIVWRESGELLYLHKQPILTNKDVVKLVVNKTDFGGTAIPDPQFTLYFHLTKEAQKRLAETCGPSGEKLLAAFVDGQRYGTPYYLKSRDELSFVPFAGMISSKAKVDQIVATFAQADQASRPRVKLELRWAEFRHVPGLTEEKGVPFGEGDSPLTYFHKQALLTNEDIAEVRIEGEITQGVGETAKKLHGVNLYLTNEGKEKLKRAGEPGKKKLLATLIDGRNASTMYVDVADLSKFVQPVGMYERPDAERLAAGIKRPAAPAPEAKAPKAAPRAEQP